LDTVADVDVDVGTTECISGVVVITLIVCGICGDISFSSVIIPN
jgi:hypothetical protein